MNREPKPKRNKINDVYQPLPLFEDEAGNPVKFSGHFNGAAVIVDNPKAMKMFYCNGYFGKASYSRGYPSFEDDNRKTQVIRRRLLDRRKKWGEKFHGSKRNKVIVTRDSESEEELEDYFTNLRPVYEIDCDLVKETLNLSLEEAFFLLDAIKCLELYFEDKLLIAEETWIMFQETDKYFVQNYLVYYYFRSKNWVVKNGLKFGGDFLLYKKGPAFYHASYVVIIDILDAETLERIEEKTRRSMDIVSVNGLNRLCETAGKELLVCQLIWPKNLVLNSTEDMTKVTIKEVVLSRWIPPQEREQKQCE